MKTLVFDTETHMFEPWDKVRTVWSPPDLVCLSYVLFDDNEPTESGVLTFKQPEEIVGLLSKCARWVGHNLSYDLWVLDKFFKDHRFSCSLQEMFAQRAFQGQVFDTRVMFRLRDPMAQTVSLSAIYARLFGKALDKGGVRTSFRRETPLTDEQKEYALQDAEATARVFFRLRQIAMGGLVPRDYEVKITCENFYNGPDPDVLYCTAACYRAFNLETTPLHVNRDALEKEYVVHNNEVLELLKSLYNDGLAKPKMLKTTVRRPAERAPPYRRWTYVPRFDLWLRGEDDAARMNTWSLNEKELREAYGEIASAFNIDAPKSEKTGELSLKYDFWKQYTGCLTPRLQTHMKLGKKRKYLSCFLQPLIDCQATKVYPSYGIPGAETGRWACWQPNLQQLTRSLRHIYRTEGGRRFVIADYKSLELYTLANSMAALAIQGALLEDLRSGKDIHQLTADRLGVSRQEAKAANFGLPGGMGNARFLQYCTQQCGLPYDMRKAFTLRAAWFLNYPDVQEYLSLFSVNPYKDLWEPSRGSKREWLRSLGFDTDRTWPSAFDLVRHIEDGEIYTVKLPSGRVIPRRRFSAAANCFFQATGAEIITLAFNEVCRRGMKVAGVIHDSIILDVPSDTAQQIGEALVKVMQTAQNLVCPMVPAPLPEFTISEVLK